VATSGRIRKERKDWLRAMVSQCAYIHKRKDELFTSLVVDGVEWHNNEAERALWPIVVASKYIYSVLMSVSAR